VVDQRQQMGKETLNFWKNCHIFRSITCANRINKYLSVSDWDHNLYSRCGGTPHSATIGELLEAAERVVWVAGGCGGVAGCAVAGVVLAEGLKVRPLQTSAGYT
jgi:hypothetical protein